MTESSEVKISSSGTKGLSGSAIKYIAIIAMAIDHYAWLFVPTQSFLGQLLHFIGRTTAPVMAFFITEGFHHTRDLKKYFIRLGVFAVVSQFAFAYFNTRHFFKLCKLSVIATLFLGLLTLWLYNSERIPKFLKVPAIVLILYASDHCDWGERIIWFVLAFEIARGKPREQIISYGLTAFVLKIIPIMTATLKAPASLVYNWMNFGVLLPIPLLMLYSGKRGGGKLSKWVFYIFYPLHLIILTYIRVKTR